ncbi:MAG: hypothetical protein JO247_00680 [Chloroflexi bacterium]|nr:hypothetical protein [Chloroflexota bacterium]
MKAVLAGTLMLLGLGLLPGPALAQAAAPPSTAAPGCQFVLGFKGLHDEIPDIAGDCIDNQAFAPNGDAQQHSTKGLFAWRKADNWTAFTNGYMTWINGPSGLVSRLNTDLFPWETPTPVQAPVIPSPSPAASPSPSAAPGTSGYGPVSTSGPAPGNTGYPFAPSGVGFNITIDDALGFQPQNMTIHQKDCVTWTNVRGLVVHAVRSDIPAFDSGGLNQNQSFVWCYQDVGTFNYYDPTTQFQGFDQMHQLPIIDWAFKGTITVVPK